MCTQGSLVKGKTRWQETKALTTNQYQQLTRESDGAVMTKVLPRNFMMTLSQKDADKLHLNF